MVVHRRGDLPVPRRVRRRDAGAAAERPRPARRPAGDRARHRPGGRRTRPCGGRPTSRRSTRPSTRPSPRCRADRHSPASGEVPRPLRCECEWHRPQRHHPRSTHGDTHRLEVRHAAGRRGRRTDPGAARHGGGDRDPRRRDRVLGGGQEEAEDTPAVQPHRRGCPGRRLLGPAVRTDLLRARCSVPPSARRPAPCPAPSPTSASTTRSSTAPGTRSRPVRRHCS